MMTNFIGRSAALLTVAFFLAISVTASGQKSTPISLTRANELLTAGDAGILRDHLVSKLNGKLDKISTSERISIVVDRKAVELDIVSQLVSYKTGNIEQITASFTEDGVIKTINLVQYANGEVGVLEGDKLVTYSLASREQACLDQIFGPGSNCAACKSKVTACRNSSNRVVKILACLARNIDGSCFACGVSLSIISACILLP